MHWERDATRCVPTLSVVIARHMATTYPLLRRALLRPCKALFKKILSSLIKCRMRIGIISTEEEHSVDLSLPIHLQWWCGKQSVLINLDFTCRRILGGGTPATTIGSLGEKGGGGQTDPVYPDSPRTMISGDGPGTNGRGAGTQHQGGRAGGDASANSVRYDLADF